MINGVTMKGKSHHTSDTTSKNVRMIHINHMGIEKTRLSMRDSVYGINMNTDIEVTLKLLNIPQIPQTWPKIKIVPCEVSGIL